jgi:hypothetical protein
MIKIKIDKYCVFLRNYLDANYDKFCDKDFSETKQELQSDDLYKGSFNNYVDKKRGEGVSKKSTPGHACGKG